MTRFDDLAHMIARQCLEGRSPSWGLLFDYQMEANRAAEGS